VPYGNGKAVLLFLACLVNIKKQDLSPHDISGGLTPEFSFLRFYGEDFSPEERKKNIGKNMKPKYQSFKFSY